MARIQADDRQTQRFERVPVPGRQQPALEADPLSTDVRNWTLFDIENWTPG